MNTLKLTLHYSNYYMWSTQFGFPYMPFLAFSSPAVWCRVFQSCVFQSCSFDSAVFSGLAFSVPPSLHCWKAYEIIEMCYKIRMILSDSP